MDDRSLAFANERLRDEFVDRVPAAKVDEIFLQSVDELAHDAKVDKFVPLLAERRVRERLFDLARA